MNGEVTFRISLAIIGALLYAIRFYYIGLTARSGDNMTASRAGKARQLLSGAVGLTAMIVPAIYVFVPYWLEWAALSMAGGWRWLGVGLGLLSVALLFWIHRTLGNNYDMPGVIKEQQTLVTSGPYQWIRHPMYSTFFLSGLATFLISANWFVGAVFLVYCAVAASTVGMEEMTLIEKFGHEYRAYMRQTARFLPGVF